MTTAELARVGIPHGVRGVIQRRLSQLSAAARRALEVSAVAGVDFDLRTVRGVLALGVDEPVDSIDEARAAGLVREADAGRFAFAHALVRHAVLDGLSRTRLVRLHWRVAEELEGVVSDSRSRLGEIAHHYALGAETGDAATVARAALAAGDDALQRVAFEEAAGHFRTALAALDRIAPDPDMRHRVLISLGHTLNALAQPDEAEELWLRAADIAKRARDPERLFAAFLSYEYVLRVGDEPELVRLLDEVLELLGPGDSSLRASALGWKAVPSQWANPLSPGDARLADEAVAMARRVGDPAALASTLQSRLAWQAHDPDAQAMLRDAEELVALRPLAVDETSIDPTGVFRYAPWHMGPAVRVTLARALLRVGRRADAEQHLADAEIEAEMSRLPMSRSSALTLRAALATANVAGTLRTVSPVATSCWASR